MADDRHFGKSKRDHAPAMQSDDVVAQPETTGRHNALAAFDAHQALLLSIAYRMLGSRADAEDMVQETFLRWQQASDAEIRDPRAFLVTVITRLCINQLQSARVKREQYFGQWLPEPVLTGPMAHTRNMPGIDGSLSIAFLMLLERLTPMERAVFLLREVFDYEYPEVATALGQSEVNCRQILKRAKQHIEEGRPRFNVSPAQQERLLQQFLETTADGDMQAFLALLSEDVVLYTDGGGKATAVPNPIYGAERVARFFFGAREKLMPKDVVRHFAGINNQPGVVVYHQGRVFGVLTLEVAEDRIRNIYIVRNPDKLERLSKLFPAPY
jgi:RNA polymerase sigma-70 factor, ECF subfamily